MLASIIESMNAADPRPTADRTEARRRELARRVIDTEAAAVAALVGRIDDGFMSALDILLACRGRVIVSGMGKSGHIARKLAATFASTGTPAHFVHPAEAAHGDLGMITGDDVLVALSNSGESDELAVIVPLVKRQGARLIALTGNPRSSLARQADAHLDTSVATEACPLGLAPTASTTAALAMGDALAVTLLDARGFGPEDFARSHPGGVLGRRLLTRVRDVMRSGEAIPMVPAKASIGEAVLEISRKGLGMTAVMDHERLVGIFTDGDLRRLIADGVARLDGPVSEAMTRAPRTIGEDALAVDAVTLMEQRRISQLLVTDDAGRVSGALNMHDLFQAKVV
jgi:arabinose-5-phosphate isomerase